MLIIYTQLHRNNMDNPSLWSQRMDSLCTSCHNTSCGTMLPWPPCKEKPNVDTTAFCDV